MQIVRPLKLSDTKWITQELRALPAQSALFADVPDDPEYVNDQLMSYIMADALIGVVDEANQSFLLATKTKPWYADRLEIHEMMFWVPEERRNQLVGYRLIKSFVDLAKSYSPHSIHAGVSLDITEADRVLALYEKLGFKRDKHGVCMRVDNV